MLRDYIFGRRRRQILSVVNVETQTTEAAHMLIRTRQVRASGPVVVGWVRKDGEATAATRAGVNAKMRKMTTRICKARQYVKLRLGFRLGLGLKYRVRVKIKIMASLVLSFFAFSHYIPAFRRVVNRRAVTSAILLRQISNILMHRVRPASRLLLLATLPPPRRRGFHLYAASAR